MNIPVKCRNGYLPLFDAIKDVVDAEVRDFVSPSNKARFNSILSYVNHARSEGNWYYFYKDNKKFVRCYTKTFHSKEIFCVHLSDLLKWLDRKDTESARLNIRLDLVRLEKHAIDLFVKRGFKGVIKKSGLFQTGNKYDVNKFLIFAQQLEASEKATDEDVINARIALALPELWNDFRSKKFNTWVFSSRMAILCSAVPDPQAKKILLKEKDDEIEANKENVDRGEKVINNASEGGVARGETFEVEKNKFLELARICMLEPKYKGKWRGWKTSLSLEVVGRIKK